MRKINYKIVMYFLVGYVAVASLTMGVVSSKLSTGFVNGVCNDYIKDFKYVNGVASCPILTEEGKKSFMLTPTALPNVVGSKIRYININGIKDATVFYSLVAPVLLVLSILPLMLVLVKLERRGLLALSPKLATFRNVILIVIYYLGFSSFFSIYSFYFMLK